MKCAFCGFRVLKHRDHDECHILFDTPKSYEEYKLQDHSASIIARYGAPPEAQPPRAKDKRWLPKSTDFSYRATAGRAKLFRHQINNPVSSL